MTGPIATGKSRFSRERSGKDGKPRYVALYRDLKGRQHSTGTYASERQADRAWQRAEARLELGRVGHVLVRAVLG